MSRSATISEQPLFRTSRGLSRAALLILGYNLAVIVWGAFVRATGSGAGCGEHWPLCNGQVVPRSPTLETLIELSHRLTSGLSLLLVVGLAVLVFRGVERGHPARRAAAWSVVFILTEALIGAGLVLLGLVAENKSVLRAWALPLHLLNTFILLGWNTATAWWLRQTPDSPPRRPGPGWLRALGIAALGVTCLIGASGAVAALGDTLFPSTGTLREALAADFSPASHWLLRLRVWHPVLAIAGGIFVIGFTQAARVAAAASGSVTRLCWAITGLVLTQWTAGFINVALLAPVWLQLVHLLLADALWIALVLLLLESSPHERKNPSRLKAAFRAAFKAS
jgi:heme A synthase